MKLTTIFSAYNLAVAREANWQTNYLYFDESTPHAALVEREYKRSRRQVNNLRKALCKRIEDLQAELTSESNWATHYHRRAETLQTHLSAAQNVIAEFVYPQAPMTPAQRAAWEAWEKLEKEKETK